MYDSIGAVQFAFLSGFFGLRETHKLLEIGSGSLRAARFLIPYLDSGNYCGVEPNTNSVRLGIDQELGAEMAERKKPRFTARRDFDFREFGERFDFALSYSVFTHVPPTQVPMIFANAADVFHDTSILLATACLHDVAEQIVDEEQWTDLPINIYSFDRMEQAAASAGLRMLFLGHAFQDWFVAFKDGNQTAIRNAEQMSKVDWPALLPPWQDPGWKRPIRKPAE
jgi:cyclopropane fatty-acyl-phospholipid synthase-like methyltransferase